jgi:AcrR family transcriptional regulator
MHGRQDAIRVSDIAARANVGRSTFYDHFTGADDVFMASVSRPLALLADAAAGTAGADRLEPLLRHFWEVRQRSREMLAGRQGERIARLLAELIDTRLGEGSLGDAPLIIPQRLAALQLAEAALALVRGWLMAQAPCPSAILAQAICVTSAALRGALRA